MKKLLLLLSLFIGFFPAAYSQQLTWVPIADFPGAGRYAPHSFMIGNDLYVGGGADTLSPVVAANDLQQYDPSSNSWTPKAALPGGLNMYGANTFVLNGKAYVVDGQIVPGSYNYNTSLYEYDPTADSWSAKSSFPGTPGYTATSFSIGPYGFLGLGFSPYITDFYCYNSLIDSWSQVASYPAIGRQGAVAFVINGVAYVGGGGQQVGSTFVNYNDFYKYDTISNQWAAIDSFPGIARRYGSCIVYNGKGYVIGGAGATSTDIYNDVWQYDPQANNWTQLDTFPVTIWGSASGSNGSYAIAGLGGNSAGMLSNKLWQIGKGSPSSVTEVSSDISKIWFSNNTMHIRFQTSLSESKSLNLYDVSGRAVANIMLQKNENSFDLPIQLINGMYLYKINSSEQSSTTHSGKIVILN